MVFQQGLGTKEHVLSEILISRSNEQIKEIKKIFKEGICFTILSILVYLLWEQGTCVVTLLLIFRQYFQL